MQVLLFQNLNLFIISFRLPILPILQHLFLKGPYGRSKNMVQILPKVKLQSLNIIQREAKKNTARFPDSLKIIFCVILRGVGFLLMK